MTKDDLCTPPTLHELERAEFVKVRPLTRPSSIGWAVDATLDGTCPGQVWVDHPVVPTAAIVDTPEGHYVTGDAHNADFCRALAAFAMHTLSPGQRGEHWWWFYLRCPSEAWVATLQQTLPSERTVEKPREFYVCERVAIDWRGNVPAGFELVRADEQFLTRDDLGNLDNLRRWAKGNFASIERFLEKGFAFCMLHDNKIVSRCCADNTSGKHCEVGVHTDKDYRRRGLATLTVAAAVDWALSNGYEQVGWHCFRYNVASAATARKVGFRKATDYTAFKICARAADADVLRGNHCLIQHNFAEAAMWYEKAFQAEVSANEPASYILSRPVDKALYTLQAACVQTLAGEREAGIESLDAFTEASGYRQGGY